MRIPSALLAGVAGLALFLPAGMAAADIPQSWGPPHTTYFKSRATTPDYSPADRPDLPAVNQPSPSFYYQPPNMDDHGGVPGQNSGTAYGATPAPHSPAADDE